MVFHKTSWGACISIKNLKLEPKYTLISLQVDLLAVNQWGPR